MTIRGLNHITLATTDLSRAVSFYSTSLGFELEHQWEQGAYLVAGNLWLCLSLDDHVNVATDYTHVAFDVSSDVFAATCARLVENGVQQWKQNCSEGDSFYFTDPDGHRLELHVGNLASRMEHILQTQTKEALKCTH